ncbi:hypothetical protein TorRG33x02_166110 [Trema orientale]|uniref:Uncharacterized protein n=1 Tax=Trema orientale TaxID=63057 RepID=A0A2P5EPX1_TREOI|nr:hypothetical protein TorRG33x02_166110 [Trema orientale]
MRGPVNQEKINEEKKKKKNTQKLKRQLRRCRGSNPGHPRDRRIYLPLYYNDFWQFKSKKGRRCRGSNPGHPRDRREYLPLYYNDVVDKASLRLLQADKLTSGITQL